MDDSTHLESYAVKKSASKVISLLCTGMEFAHPITVDWSLFNKSADIWPDDALLWFVYGKFAAIYPEEMNMIAYIIRNIMSHNLKGFMIKQMIQQAYIIQNQRENSLTAELKRHITNLSKKVSQTKTKMRHVWDLVIQGNVSEMDNAVKISYRSVEDTKNEFNHVLMKYPNNRFVARSYSRFLYEIAGDRKTFNEWKDKINLLKNGMLANDDKARLLGLAAFPNLPKISTSSSKSALSVATNIESEIFTNFDEFNEEENQIQDEQIRLLVDKIDNLSIPSLKCATITTLVLILLLAVCLTIGVYAYTDYFIKDLKPPIDLLYHVNLIRMYAFMMPLWVHHLIMENMPRAVGTTMKVMNIPNVSDIKLDAVGGFETTKQQLQFFMRQCSISVEALGEFHNYYPDDVLLKPIRTILFDPVIEHHYYQNQYSYTPKNMSLSDIVTDNIVLLGAFLNQENSSPTFWFTGMNQPNTLNSFMSAHLLNNNISQVLDLMDIYMEDLTVYTALLLTYVEIGISIAMGIIWIITAIISINWIEKDKIIIYKSLMSLPKNVVSSASESLRILKKSDEESGTTSEVDSEFSKQEDAMLKLFNTATDSSSIKSLDKILFIIIYIIVMGGTIGVGMLLCSLLPNICETINANSAHISNIMGISSYMMGAEISLNDGVISTFGYGPYAPKYTGIGGRNTSLLFNMTEEQLQQLVNSYNFVKFGSEDAYSKPYPQFFETIDQANANFACEDKNAKLTTIRESLDCLSYDSQIIQFSNMVRRYIEPYKIFTSQVVYDPQETMLDEIWRLGIKLYSTTISPMFENVVQTMTSAMKSDANKAIPFIVILIVVCFIAFFVMLFVTSSIRTHLKFALKYVLHCNVTAVTSTAKIMEVLSGEFRPISKDNAMRNKLYYDSVMKELPDNIIVADQNFKVIEFNKAFERMLSSTIQEGDDLRTFFKSDEFIDKDFQLTNNQEKVLQYIKKDGDGIVLHLLTKCVVVSQSYVVTLRDITQIVMYNNLIKEERNKSDKLLASILPPNLVTRVQNGEKNISFAVQSATILFMDIVEFTPWCASGTAAGVMSTLNLMYRYFDSNLSKGKTLTKIKCIGDCYMAAGGIFCEINQPAVHAKEAVEFGLSSIDSIRQLNAEKNENLKIRVGVNTGGPIVAGVLGTEKPTFEILGPAINMAQQMEHNGVPMQVHVSRPVYELIYGGTIRIKERGQIQIKNGKVVTYLVEGREEA
ncbi:Adenylate and Guanylate cyclase catalytic domain containing protein [Tritrichomonas foetus]|uniref:Adenylate and Guanylate cyclase catalytic domain containing protein n=1 Tax=Tritrichomonas foetus TaxID=1144522 RepID=A0A1J4KGC1_9EUKA|nr:Adenylate and Guanylate cyclase catalytic domain containing protein [Tritrichomonas foetus]|eukprot:OHT10090.1 Adenylate and Guanylate cyclase catalytic domain containing protein [Tritrichomonas foetus]